MRLTSPLDDLARRDAAIARVLMVASFCALGAGPVAAQKPIDVDPRVVYATRPELEARVALEERAARDSTLPPGKRGYHRGEAFMLRDRLREGDFAVGDRIVIDVVGEPTLTDTFTVRSGPVLQMADLPPIALAGVLRSELQSHVSDELGRYLQHPRVTVVPLLRVAVMGEVGNPGFYHVPADMLLSDVLMVAGGPAGDADLKRSQIRRGGDALLGSQHFTIALEEGLSLDALSLRSGDEVRLRERRRADWRSILQFVSIASGLVTLLVSLGN